MGGWPIYLGGGYFMGGAGVWGRVEGGACAERDFLLFYL